MSSTFTLRRATRQKTKMRVAIAGPSGSGKTYSALLLASGMAPWEKIVLIDTENGSGELYAHLGPYSVVTLHPPFTPERYLEAISACEKAGMEVIIVDSMSHEWNGRGGILETKDAMSGNSYTHWKVLTPRHNAFIDQMIIRSSCHIIATLRTKQDYVLVENDRGKQVPQKIGLKAITRDEVDYEFTLVFDLNINHIATASKDRTRIFMDPDKECVVPEKITAETGQKLLAWTLTGAEPQPAEQQQPAPMPHQTKEATPVSDAPATQEQLVLIDQLCQQTDTSLSKIKAAYKITTDIPTVEAAAAMIDGLQKKLALMKAEEPAPVAPFTAA